MPVSTDWVVQRRLWRSPSQQSTTPRQFTTATATYFPWRSYQSWRPSQQNSHIIWGKAPHDSSPITSNFKLVVKDLHETHLHVAREHTLALVRQQFWITQGKSLARKIVNDCLYCRRRRTEPKVPVMADLPREDLHFLSLRLRTLEWTISVLWMLREEEAPRKGGDASLLVLPPARSIWS